MRQRTHTLYPFMLQLLPPLLPSFSFLALYIIKGDLFHGSYGLLTNDNKYIVPTGKSIQMWQNKNSGPVSRLDPMLKERVGHICRAR